MKTLKVTLKNTKARQVWMAQSSKPENDAVGFVQPSIEIMDRVAGITRDAGTRPVRPTPRWRPDACAREEHHHTKN